MINRGFFGKMIWVTKKKSGVHALVPSVTRPESYLNKETQAIRALVPDWGIDARIASGQSKFFKLPIEGFAVNVQGVGCFSPVTIVGRKNMGDIK